jgi:antitoxin component YwqK of YwqJK toxin-antitoxin module
MKSFGDENFKYPKIIGFYSQNIPIGIWQEYYSNGNCKYEGLCKKFSFYNQFDRRTPSIDTLKIVDESLPTDTVKINFNRRALDSIVALTQYAEGDIKYPSYGELNSNSAKSLKSGKWIYYNEDGTVARIEFYSNGRLLKVERK